MSNNIVHRTIPNTGSPWNEFSAGNIKVTKIIIHEDIIYGIGIDNTTYQTSSTSGGSWDQVGTLAIKDLAYWNGYLHGVTKDGSYVVRIVPNNGSWSQFTDTDGIVSKIIIHEDIIYGIDPEHKVWQASATTGGSWTQVSSSDVRDIAFWDGYLYGVSWNSKVVKTVLYSMTWHSFPVGADVSKIIIHEGIMYGIGLDNAVYQTDGLTSGASWIKVAPCCVTDLAIITTSQTRK